MTTLIPRQPVPTLAVDTLNSEKWLLSQQQPKNFTLILFYRGYHCPICKSQLRDYNRNLAKFKELGVDVIAISSNDKALAEQTKEAWELDQLTIGYGLSIEKAQEWGLYISEAIKETEPAIFSEPGLFVMRPDGTLYAAIYQTMPFARASADAVLGGLSYAIKENYPARGEVTS